MNKTLKAFTLIEILIVIAIIGMILAVFLPNFNELRRKSRDQARKAGVKAYVEALELFKLNQNPPAYPASIPATPGSAWTVANVTYMNQTPIDPLYSSLPLKFFYRYSRVDNVSYYIGACLEDPSDPEGRVSPGPGIFNDSECDTKKWYYKTQP